MPSQQQRDELQRKMAGRYRRADTVPRVAARVAVGESVAANAVLRSLRRFDDQQVFASITDGTVYRARGERYGRQWDVVAFAYFGENFRQDVDDVWEAAAAAAHAGERATATNSVRLEQAEIEDDILGAMSTIEGLKGRGTSYWGDVLRFRWTEGERWCDLILFPTCGRVTYPGDEDWS